MKKPRFAAASCVIASQRACPSLAQFPGKSLFATALLCLAHAAHALGASAGASISNLHFQLIDLDPNDGVTPWIQSYSQEKNVGGLSIFGVLREPKGDYGEDYADNFDTLFESVSPVRISEGLKTATVEVSGRPCCTRQGMDSGDYLRMSTSALDTGLGHYDGNYTYVSSSAGFLSGLLTSANTRVVITADASTRMSADYDLPAGFVGSVSGKAALHLYEYGSNEPIDDATSFAGHEGRSFHGGLDDSRPLRLEFETGSSEKVFGFGVSTVSTTHIYSPAPEPSSFALMAAGLVAVSLGVQRRRRRAQEQRGRLPACSSRDAAIPL